MSTTQMGSFSHLPAEIFAMIVEEAAGQTARFGPYVARPRNDLLAVSRLSQASKAIRRHCLPTLLSYIWLEPAHAPSLLQWFHRDPHIANLVRVVNLIDCTDYQSRLPTRWASDAASAIALEKACPTVPEEAHQAHHSLLLGNLVVCILKCTWNLRAIVNAGFDYPLEEWTAGQVQGAALEFLHCGAAAYCPLPEDQYTKVPICPAMQILRLFEREGALHNLKNVVVRHSCIRSKVCLWCSPQRERWLSNIGPKLTRFGFLLDEYLPDEIPPAAIKSMLDSMPSIRQLQMSLSAFTHDDAFAEGDHQSDIWSPLAEALVSTTYLPSTLVRLEVDMTYDPTVSAREPVEGFFLAHLTHFSCLKRLSMPFPRVSAIDTDITISLPPALESLIFIDVGCEWSDWVHRRGGRASLRPWALLSNAVQHRTVPSGLLSIVLGVNLDKDDGSGVYYNRDYSFRWKFAAWEKELVSLFLETLKGLKDNCSSRGIQIHVSALYSGPLYSVGDLMNYLDSSERLQAERRLLAERRRNRTS